jgi:bacterioferritin (cytochrome b1)
MTNNYVLWTIFALIAVAIVIVLAAVSRHRARLLSMQLQQKFGPEYERAVEDFGGAARAERELAARARRVRHFRFQELTEADRARFATSWNRIQAQFVDDPVTAVADADQLINEVMRARGYPSEDFEQRVADLSVEHPVVVQHYRAATQLIDSTREELTTEHLRQAVVHYRHLFAELLQESESHARHLHEAHA